MQQNWYDDTYASPNMFHYCGAIRKMCLGDQVKVLVNDKLNSKRRLLHIDMLLIIDSTNNN